MAMSDIQRREVFSAREIARAAGVNDAAVARLIADGTITSVDGAFVAFDEARRAAARLRAGECFPQTAAVWSGTPGVLFARHHATRRSPGVPAAASAAIHGVMLGGLLIAAGAIGLFAPGALPQIPALADPATAWTLLGAGIALDLGAAAVIVQRMRSRQ
jgi:hypothetical protein